jgi:hypothetical protein
MQFLVQICGNRNAAFMHIISAGSQMAIINITKYSISDISGRTALGSEQPIDSSRLYKYERPL